MVVRAVTIWVFMAALYLFLAGSLDRVELLAAAFCASVATLLAGALRHVTERPMRLRPPLRALVAPLRSLVAESFVVGTALARAVGTGTAEGQLVQQPFEPGDDSPDDAGRRALAVIALSIAPRAFAVRRENEAGLLVHSFPPKAVSADTRWPA